MRRFTLPFLAAMAMIAVPAQAEVVQSSEAGFVIRESADVPVDTYAAWAALTAPAKWWNPAHSWSGKAENLYIDSQASGCFCELMPVPAGAPEGTRRGSVEHMHIVHSSPGKVLRMVGGLGPLQSEALTGVLTVTLKKTPKGTRILWEYVVGGFMRYKTADIAPAVDKVLAEQLARLSRQLGGEPATPDAPADKAPSDKAPGDKALGDKASGDATDVPAQTDPAGGEPVAEAAKPTVVKPLGTPKKPAAKKSVTDWGPL